MRSDLPKMIMLYRRDEKRLAAQERGGKDCCEYECTAGTSSE